jgi:hypothetical protein
VAEPKALIFLHVPKTAGSSLTAILEEQYARERSYSTSFSGHHPNGSLDGFHALPAARLVVLDLLYGHMPYGLHQKLPRPADYITLLRDPVSRVISNYFFEGREPGSYLYEQVRSGAMDIDGYLDYVRELGIDNIQTRMIAGIYDPDGGPPLTQEIPARAQENLERNFAFVGLQEAFEDSYLMLRRRYGWRYSDYQHYGVAPRSQNRAAVPERVRQRIAREHAYDVAVYQFAQELFARQRAAQARMLVWERLRFRFWRSRRRLACRLRVAYSRLRRISIRYWLRHHFGRQL